MTTAPCNAGQPEVTATPAAIPGPGRLAVLRSLLFGRRSGFVQRSLEQWRRYSDPVSFRLGPLTVVLVTHPDHVQELVTRHRDTLYKGRAYEPVRRMIGLGLVTSEGELWRRQRRLMQPHFTPRAVARLADVMTSCAADLLARWDRLPPGTPLDVEREMQRLTMRIIARTMLGVDLGEELGSLGRAFGEALDFISARSAALLPLPLLLPTPAHRRFRAAMALLDGYVYRLIERRRAAPETGEDLVAHLLAARDEMSGAPLDDRQIRDEVLTIFFAGHETTALALTWCFSLLSRHPEVEQRLAGELEAVLGGQPPSLEDLPRLRYTRAVIDETLRLYPPAPLFPRNVRHDDAIGGCALPAGSMVLFSPYITHRRADCWPEPDAFRPERFLDGRSKEHPPYAYFPFGISPRTCIGNHFALLEAQIVLATIAQRYRLRRMPGPDVLPGARGTLHPDRPVLLALERRWPAGSSTLFE